jgi:hypothetical protein
MKFKDEMIIAFKLYFEPLKWLYEIVMRILGFIVFPFVFIAFCIQDWTGIDLGIKK